MITLQDLHGALVASCQPVAGSPMDTQEIIVAMARSSEIGGARALRIEGSNNVAAVKSAVSLPVVGIVKREVATTPVCITARLQDARALVEAGADVVAFDATNRIRDEPLSSIVEYLLLQDVALMADCATLDDAKKALQYGVHIVGTTLAGYTEQTRHLGPEPDYEFVRQCAMLTENLPALVMAEGRFNSPVEAQQALQAGADCVTVGSAITRIEHIVGWFTEAMARA